MMKIDVQPGNYWCVTQRGPLSEQRAVRDIQLGRCTPGDFTVIHTRLPAHERTRFQVYADKKYLLVAVLPADRVDRFDSGDSVEVFFDPFHDHVGFFQFWFSPGSDPLICTHLPYAEAHSSAFRRIDVARYSWGDASVINVVGQADHTPQLFARFDRESVFRGGPRCGFNVTRSSAAYREPGSWNPCPGTLFQDATGFGHLYAGINPVTVDVKAASIERDYIAIAGEVSAVKSLAFNLLDPAGNGYPVQVRRSGNRWVASAHVPGAMAGRWRLCPRVSAEFMEPEFLFFDLPGSKRRQFTIGITYDSPDDLRANAYTPARLERQVKQLRQAGVNRIYWIDYPPYPEFPAFWDWAGNRKFCRSTQRTCGDLLPRAARLSKRLGLEFLGVFKPFDLGFTGDIPEDKRRGIYDLPGYGLAAEFDGSNPVAWPPIAKHPEWTMQAREDWTPLPDLPLTTLRFHSNVPLPAVKQSDVTLWVSRDNRRFDRYSGKMRVRQGTGTRPNLRWTPAGNVREQGSCRDWWVEIGGLAVHGSFAAIEIRVGGFRLANLRFLVAEAEGQNGQAVVVTPASAGDVKSGFRFHARWSWNNYTEEVVDRFVWTGVTMGIAFVQPARLPTVFEPCYPQVRSLWLGQVERILRTEADGVDIRTLCHHNTTFSWLRYAFAPAVVQAFREEFGREPGFVPADLEGVRRIRGKAYTEFMRGAKALAVRYGKKLAAHLEPGIEVPLKHHVRMQMAVEWKRWIEEGLLDEITLKYWGARSSFVHTEILPLARRAGIPVHICDRNFSLNMPRATELASALVREARGAGIDGLNFYEVCSYFLMNGEGESWPLGSADHALIAARREAGS